MGFSVTGREKWLFSKPFQIFHGVLFYAFMITMVLSNIFYTDNKAIAIATVVLNGVLLLFEILKILAYCLYQTRRWAD